MITLKRKKFIDLRGKNHSVGGAPIVGYIRCPKCREPFAVFNGQLNGEGESKKPLICSARCGFWSMLKISNYNRPRYFLPTFSEDFEEQYAR
jgi:hypothetical protein